MEQVREHSRTIVPVAFRRALYRAWKRKGFSAAMREFISNPEACAAPDSPLIDRLISGWASPGWSAMHGLLAAAVSCALSAVGPSLECGSGLSTIVIGAIAASRGYHHWVLEHDPSWARLVGRALQRYGVASSVHLCTAPIKDYGGCMWYRPPLGDMPRQFDFVLCDGPPATFAGARYGLVPIMKPRLSSRCVLLLDDTDRNDVRETARRWGREMGGAVQFDDDHDSFAQIALGSR